MDEGSYGAVLALHCITRNVPRVSADPFAQDRCSSSTFRSTQQSTLCHRTQNVSTTSILMHIIRRHRTAALAKSSRSGGTAHSRNSNQAPLDTRPPTGHRQIAMSLTGT